MWYKNVDKVSFGLLQSTPLTDGQTNGQKGLAILCVALHAVAR